MKKEKEIKKDERKVLSHAERFWNALQLENNRKPLPSEELKVVTEVSLDNGVKITKSQLKTEKFADRNKGLRWYDFSIDSLQLCGAVSNLGFSMFTTNGFDAVDKLDRYAYSVENKVNNLVKEENNNN